jgi:hypothetical protein
LLGRVRELDRLDLLGPDVVDAEVTLDGNLVQGERAADALAFERLDLDRPLLSRPVRAPPPMPPMPPNWARAEDGARARARAAAATSLDTLILRRNLGAAVGPGKNEPNAPLLYTT